MEYELSIKVDGAFMSKTWRVGPDDDLASFRIHFEWMLESLFPETIESLLDHVNDMLASTPMPRELASLKQKLVDLLENLDLLIASIEAEAT